jgi:hypothetical protein
LDHGLCYNEPDYRRSRTRNCCPRHHGRIQQSGACNSVQETWERSPTHPRHNYSLGSQAQSNPMR